MEKQSTETGTESGYLYGKNLIPTFKVAVYQHWNKNGCTEHGKHMLQTEQQHFWNA